MTRASLLLSSFASGLSLAAALASSQASAEQVTRLSPDDYIEARCTFCHSRMLSIVLLQRMVDEEGTVALGGFLARHNLPDPDARRSLLEYFETLQAEDPGEH